MKFKPTLSAIIVALALTGTTLVGCNAKGNGENKNSSSNTQEAEKFHVDVSANDEYSVTGLNAEGYAEGATVNFAITLTHPEDKAIRQVTASAGTQAVSVTAGENGYSFTMPAHDVNISIALRDIEKYVLSYEGSANADETITLDLKLGTAPVADDFVIEGKTDADKAKITVDGEKVTLNEAGEVTLVAKINNEVKAELKLTVGQSLVMSVKDALDAAIVEAPCNAKTGKNANISTAKTISGKVLAVSSYSNGAVQAIVDDGTAAVVVQIEKAETADDPVSIGASIRVTAAFTNYFGLLEGISKDAKTGDNAKNIPADDVKVINKAFTPKLATPENMTAAQYEAYYTTCANNGKDSGDNRTWTEIKNANINVTFDSGSLYAIDGTEKKIDVKSSHDKGESLDAVAGHKSTLTGFLLGVNSRDSKSNAIIMGQTALAVQSVELTDGDSISMFKNNEKQLAYTTLPAGSYGVESWVSSNTAAVTVENGLVTAVESGQADVTLTINGKSDTIHINVSGEEIPAQSVSLDKTTADLEMGSTLTLTPTTNPAVVTDQAQWSSSDETVATVADGVVTPVAPGKATITVTYRTGVSASCEVTVKAVHGTVADDPLTADEAYTIGKALKGEYNKSVYTDLVYYVKDVVTAKVTPADGKVSSDNALGNKIGLYNTKVGTEVAAKCEKGAEVVVKGQICNYSDGYKIQFAGQAEVISADNSKATLVEISGASEVKVGETINLTATVYPASLNAAATFSTEDSSYATVTAAGAVTGVAVGTAAVTASYGEGAAKISQTKNIAVVPNASYTLAKQSLFAAENNSKAVGSYTDSFDSTTNGFVVTVSNINNNNNNWGGKIGIGKKNTDHTGTIVTKSAVAEAIGKVGINITDAAQTDKYTFTLQTSADGETWADAGEFVVATGEQTVVLATPTANLYYKLVFVNASSLTSNGAVKINQVNFYKIAE